jgi:ABC-type glutathione transport system ATPase component
MQVLQAGQYKLIYLELQPEMIASIARQAGFEIRTKDGQRTIQLDLNVPGEQAPLLLFDASDPANLGWFSRCQFYVDGRTGNVMQTPMLLANKRDRGGKAQPMLIATGLTKYFAIRGGVLNRAVARVRAVDDVSFCVLKGETLGIVGESSERRPMPWRSPFGPHLPCLFLLELPSERFSAGRRPPPPVLFLAVCHRWSSPRHR